MPSSFTQTLSALSGAVANVASAREADSRTRANKIANASSFMDLQQKIRALPALKNQTKALEVGSEVALKRANARASLLTKDVIEKQEAYAVEAETSEVAMKKYSQDLAVAAQWQGPITSSNKEQFLEHLRQGEADISKFGGSEDMSPSDLGILQQSLADRYVATQKQLQAKDLMEVEQQYTLDRDQRQQFFAMQQNLQKYQFDLDLQQRANQARERIAMAGASGAEIPRQLVTYDDHQQFEDTFKKAMAARFPKADWVDDEEALTNLAGHFFDKTAGMANQAYIDYSTGRGNIPNAREYYFDQAVQQGFGQIDADGVYHEDPNSSKLQKDIKAFGNKAKQVPGFYDQFSRIRQRLGGDLTEDEFIEWMWSQGTYRGYTPDDPINMGGGVDSNVPESHRSSWGDNVAPSVRERHGF